MEKLFLIVLIFLLISCSDKYNDSDKSIRFQNAVDKFEQVLKNIPRINIEGKGDSTLKPISAFDPNVLLNVLPKIKLRKDYILDYVIYRDMNGWPTVFVRNKHNPPIRTVFEYEKLLSKHQKNINNLETSSLPLDHPYRLERGIVLENNEESYFQYLILYILSEQFYLSWHGYYNDWKIVCSKEKLHCILNELESGIINGSYDFKSYLKNFQDDIDVEPKIRFTEKNVIASICLFSKWGGLIRRQFIIERNFPHFIDNKLPFSGNVWSDDIKLDTLINYSCGMDF